MFKFGLGLIGAPLATLTGQLIGLIPRATYIFGGRAHFRPRPFPSNLVGAHILEILRVGVPASLSAGLNYVALIILTGTVARLGNEYLAAYGLGTRLDFLLVGRTHELVGLEGKAGKVGAVDGLAKVLPQPALGAANS